MTNADEKVLVASASADLNQAPLGEGAEYEGVAKHFWPVVQAHGREMFTLVYSAGVAGHAIGILQQGLRGQQGAQNAIATVAEMFNTVSRMHIAFRNWSQADLNACDLAIRQAVEAQIILPKANGRIILPS